MSYENTAHHWAHQTGKCRSAGRVHYEGPDYYSYRTRVASLVTAPGGDTVALFTNHKYSSSTSRHVSRAAGAASHLLSFTAPNLEPTTRSLHRENYEYILSQAADALAKGNRARNLASMHFDDARRLVKNANDYSDAFRLRYRRFEFESLEGYAADAEKRAERQRKAHELAVHKAEAAQRLKDRERLREWLGGGDVNPPRTKRPMVRVKDGQVETTWHASVPLKDALRVYRMAKNCHEVCTGSLIAEVGDFGVADIDKRGTIRVSCHVIPFRYAQLAARIAGIDPPATTPGGG